MQTRPNTFMRAVVFALAFLMSTPAVFSAETAPATRFQW